MTVAVSPFSKLPPPVPLITFTEYFSVTALYSKKAIIVTLFVTVKEYVLSSETFSPSICHSEKTLSAFSSAIIVTVSPFSYSPLPVPPITVTVNFSEDTGFPLFFSQAKRESEHRNKIVKINKMRDFVFIGNDPLTLNNEKGFLRFLV